MKQVKGGDLIFSISDSGFLSVKDERFGVEIIFGVETGDRFQSLMESIEISQNITDKLEKDAKEREGVENG